MNIKRLLLLCSSIFMMLGAHASADTFIDTFDDAKYTNANWGNERGNWTVSGGYYYAQNPTNSPPTYTALTSYAGLTDFTIEVDINAFQDGGIWLRSDATASNGVLLVTGGFSGSFNGLYWHVVNAGGYSGFLGATAYSGTLQGEDVHLKVVVSGDTYKVFVNGSDTPLTTLVDSSFSSGYVGLYNYCGEKFDTFKLTTAPEPVSAGLFLLGGGALAFMRRKKTAG